MNHGTIINGRRDNEADNQYAALLVDHLSDMTEHQVADYCTDVLAGTTPVNLIEMMRRAA